MVNVVSTFSGCGGSSLGYKRAGFDVKLALDFEENAVKTYQMNFPDNTVWKANIRDVTGDMILKEIGIKSFELDIFDGSPPCTPFSTSGIREKGWNKEYVHGSETQSQRADDLFFEYIRLVKELQPKSFVGENVRGLIMGKSKGYFNEILKEMKALGYKVKVFDINAKDFEVPQSRPRIIYIGIRNDVFKSWQPLKTFPEITFREATKDLVLPQNELDDSKKIVNCVKPYISLLKQGESISKYHPTGSFFSYGRTYNDRPINTVLSGSHNSIMHPVERRWLTLSEIRRCSSFPDDFKFISINDGFIRIGNSVPPNLIKHIALYIQKCANFSQKD